MSNDIVVRNSKDSGAIARYGDTAELDVLADRFAQFFNIPEKDMNLPSVKTAALKAAQLTVRFGLTPGVHIYIVKRGGTYAAEESLEAWKDAASKHSRIGHFLYDVQVREMTPEEVKANTPPHDRYTPEDKGAFARVIRFDIAREYKNIGMAYDPLWVKGFWRKEAYEKKSWDGQKMKGTGAWESDTVPNQRTPQDVAIRRATRAALKSAFTLIQLDDLNEAQRMNAAMYHMQVASAPLLNDVTESDIRIDSAEDDGLWRDSIPGVATTQAASDDLWESPQPAPAPTAPTPATAHAAQPAPTATNGNATALVDLPPEVELWESPQDAYDWAVGIGASDNVHSARNAFANAVNAHGGKLKAANTRQVFATFYAERMARAQEKRSQPADIKMADVTEMNPEGAALFA